MVRLFPVLITALLQSTPALAECSRDTKRDLANNAVVLGGLVAVCGLHKDGLIATTTLERYLERDTQRLKSEPEKLKMLRAAKEKLNREFPNCPIPTSYFQP